MKFNEYEYIRPDFESFKTKVENLIKAFITASNEETAYETLLEYFKEDENIGTMSQLAQIRFTINTNDEFYKAEDDYWSENGPLFQSVGIKMANAILASPHLGFLKTKLPKTYFMLLENAQKAFSEEIIPLLQKENKLSSDYSKLIASAQIEFDGKTLTLPQFGPYAESLNRGVRKAATEAVSGFFSENEAKFDEIYDELVKTRHEIATTLGFKNFTELGYVRMNRFDYNEAMVNTYREEVVKYVVPLVQKLRARQAKRLGLESLKNYDLTLEYLSGNATPKLNSDDILKAGQTMYHELSKETGDFIDFMMERDLFDVLSKPGKQGGGYCTYIPNYASPFIFANFNGTSGDIDVLTHEAGHAFQVYSSRHIKPLDTVWPTYETCEIHSMSMEFITWPWMENFFKEETSKYKFSHLASGLLFLPYGVCVDHFQHEVYNNPNMSPTERKQTWLKLQALYLPDRDYSENDYLNRGNVWVRQAHIYNSPFYYIDYTLAQICAFQFWKRTQVDHDENAWQDYLNICSCGGSKSFLEVVELAHLNSPFKAGALKDTLDSISHYLDNVDDSKF